MAVYPNPGGSTVSALVLPTGIPSVDVPAIRAALAAMAGVGEVILGAGTFAIGPFAADNGSIIVPSDVRMRGAGIDNTILLSTLTTEASLTAPLRAGWGAVVIPSSTVHSANVFGSDVVVLDAPVSGVLGVGNILELKGAVGTRDFLGGTYTIKALSGAGPYIVTVDRPINFQLAANDLYLTRATQIKNVRLADFTLTGSGGRLFEFGGTRECEARRIKFAPVGVGSGDWSVSFDSFGYRNFFVECELDGASANAGMVLEQQDSSAVIDCHVHHTNKHGISATNGCNNEIIRPRTHDCFAFGVFLASEGGGAGGPYQPRVIGGESYNNGPWANTIGSVDLTGLVYGPGGSLDGKTLTIGVDKGFADVVVTFVAPANEAAIFAQINAAVGATVASGNGTIAHRLYLQSTRWGVSSEIRLPDAVGGGNGMAVLGLLQEFVSANPLNGGGMQVSQCAGAWISTNCHDNGGPNLRVDTSTGYVEGNYTGAQGSAVIGAGSQFACGAIDTSGSGSGIVLTTTTLDIEKWTHVSAGNDFLAAVYTSGLVLDATSLVRVGALKMVTTVHQTFGIILVDSASKLWLSHFDVSCADIYSGSFGIYAPSGGEVWLDHGKIAASARPLQHAGAAIHVGDSVDLSGQLPTTYAEPYTQSPQSALTTKAMADTNRVLTIAEAQAQVIACTGALTGDRNIQLPKVAGFVWTIDNQTTGGHSVIAIASSGTGVNCPAGISRVYFDGTNMVAA